MVRAQTTTIGPLKVLQPESVKAKRGLFSYENAILGPPPPPPFQTIPFGHGYGHGYDHGFEPSYGPTPTPLPAHAPRALPPNKWTNIFGFDDITYHHLFNELNGINYGIPTHMTPPPAALPSIYTNGYGYLNYGAPHDYETSYISNDGRVVKQYSVHERHQNDHPDPNRFRPLPRNPSQTTPAQFPQFFNPSNNFVNAAQPRNLITNGQLDPSSAQIQTLLNRNHGPVALGSGSLGFIRSQNGDVYLGSGSLGYISHKDHFDTVAEISNRAQKTHPRGPLTFGHNHL